MNNPNGRRRVRNARSHWTPVFALGASIALMAAAALTITSDVSAATVQPHAAPTLPCSVSVSGGGQLVPSTTLITGVVAGTTQIKFDCDASSGAAVVAEASLLAGLSTSNVIPTAEADTSTVGDFTASATDVNCPAGTAGSCTEATFAVPATFSAAGDTAAQCPPSQAQINAGLFGCAIAVANSSEQEVAGGEYLVMYASQPAPAAPTIAAQPATGSPGSLINVSDAAGASGYWWGDAVQAIQALDAGTAAAVAPSSCASTSGYGNVPTADLEEAWYGSGASTPAFAGAATGVTISNDCYDGKTLNVPVLGGTMTVPSTVTTGSSYTVYLCEVNATPYPSNDSKSSSVCGTSAPFIDASFSYSVVAKTLSQNLPLSASVTSSTGFTAQLNTSGNNGAVTYTQTAGSPDVVVSSSGAVTTSGALKSGTYTASGTTADPNGDAGTFTFKLTVAGPPIITKTPAPRAIRITGWGIIGHTDVLVITGTNFGLHPRVIGHGGTVVSVIRSTATHIYLKVRVVKNAKKGTFRFIIQFSNGKRTSINYRVR